MKILLTGADGFIGHHLRTALQKAGHDVYGYDLKWGDDIRDKYQLALAFENENFDQVIHLAALAGVRRGERFPEEYIRTNVMGTKNIVDACQHFGVKRLINFSSSSVYGGSSTASSIMEGWPTDPVSIYGMTKYMAELIVNHASIETVNVRPFTVYGPGGRKDQVMMRWIQAVKLGVPISIYAEDFDDAKNVVRGYTHVNDLVRGVILLVERSRQTNNHNTYNLGGSQAISLADLLKIFSQTVLANYEFVGRQPGDAGYNVASTGRAYDELGWQPKEDFSKAVTKLIKEGMRP